MDIKVALAKHYAMRAIWSVIPTATKIALINLHRANRYSLIH